MLTIPPIVIFFAAGLAARFWFPEWFDFLGRVTSHPAKPPCSMISLHFIIALCCYIPWALLQQFQMSNMSAILRLRNMLCVPALGCETVRIRTRL